MNRTLCILAMCCVFSSVGVAQVRPNPARVSSSPAWEYGELFYVDMRFLSIQGKVAVMGPMLSALAVAGMSSDAKISSSGDSALGPVWLSADTSMFQILDAVAAAPYQPGRVGPTTLIRLLNVLGAKGWELVGVPGRSSEPYVFRRQLK